MKKHYIALMSERLVKSVLDAYHRAALGDLEPAYEACREKLREFHGDLRHFIVSRQEEDWAEILDYEVEES